MYRFSSYFMNTEKSILDKEDHLVGKKKKNLGITWPVKLIRCSESCWRPHSTWVILWNIRSHIIESQNYRRKFIQDFTVFAHLNVSFSGLCREWKELRTVTPSRTEDPVNCLMGQENAKYSHKGLKVHSRKSIPLYKFPWILSWHW